MVKLRPVKRPKLRVCKPKPPERMDIVAFDPRLVLEFQKRSLSRCRWTQNDDGLDLFPWKPQWVFEQVIETEEELQELCSKLMAVPAFAFDTETNTLRVLADNDEFKFVGISFSWGEDNNYYIPVGHLRDEDIDSQLTVDVVAEYLRPVFARDDVEVDGWNLKFDIHVMKRIGVDVKTPHLFDGMLASWLCDENTPNGLKENSTANMGISQEHFNEATATVPNEVKKRFGYKANSKVTFDLVLIEDATPYVIGDAFYTWCNCIGLKQRLVDEGMDVIYYRMYIPFLRVLFEMEEHGVTVDVERLEQMGVEMQADMDDLQYRIYELAGCEFNIGSVQQKAEILFGYRKPDKPVTKDKAPQWIKDLVEQFKCGEVTLDEVRAQLEKKGYYADEKGKVFKTQASNDHILEHAFNFKPYAQTNSGAPSTDSDTIWRLSQREYKNNKRKMQGVEMCKAMLEYAKLAKLKTAFVDGILAQLYADGKAHPSFNQIGTDSGRLSCSNPNLQQLPKANEDDKYQIRSVFIGGINEHGRRNKIIALDYHNLEMVCLTHFSGDKNLSEMFANDDDAHGSTAVNMFGLDCTPVECKKMYPHLRQAAKTINFMLMYGGGAGKLYESLKSDHFSPLDLGAKEYLEQYHCKSGKDVAQAFIDKYFESYSGVAHFIQSQKRYAHRHGCVYTILGRKRRLPDINSPDGALSSYSERLAVNASIQGTAGDITINAQIRVAKDQRLKELGAHMIIQVHDELVFECPEENVEEAITIIKHYMEHPFGDDPKKQVQYLRADSDFGDTYQDAK